MTPARNRRIRELFDAAAGQSTEAQAELLWRECGDDEDLVREVWRLLGANRKSDGFLSSPMWRSRQAEPAFGALGSLIGPYKIIRELGSGGMGIVYQTVRADEVFRRVTALKVIRPGVASDLLVAVFQQERQILAELDHPNIARIVDGGSTETGVPYFVMDYVEGVSIDQFSRQRQLSIVQRLSLFRQVCAATQYLHENRIVHGDFKPSNILVTGDGVAKILDFGIARMIDKTGVVQPKAPFLPLMTPGYASPEQLRGDSPGFTSDIYSLGVVLYELLTGVKPAPRDVLSGQELATATSTQDPPAPSAAVHTRVAQDQEDKTRWQKLLRGDLDCIVMKALNRGASDRYASAAALDADIANFLECRVVTARRAGPLYKAAKFVRRHSMALTAISFIALLLAIIGWESLELRRNQQIRSADELKIQMLQNRAMANLSNMSRGDTENLKGKISQKHLQSFGQIHMEDLRSLENGYRVSFPEAIHIWPGWTPRRRELVDQAQQYLHEAEPLVANDDAARRELARAWLLVGNVEGNPKAPNLKDRTAAEQSYGESTRMLEDVLESAPNDRSARELLEEVKSRSAAVR